MRLSYLWTELFPSNVGNVNLGATVLCTCDYGLRVRVCCATGHASSSLRIASDLKILPAGHRNELTNTCANGL